MRLSRKSRVENVKVWGLTHASESVFRPGWGSSVLPFFPTARAVGCILPPLRG